MKKHFVEFFSPGTFVSESTVKEIPSWDIDAACDMASSIKERHGAVPYGFRFLTRERGDDDLDSRVTKASGIHYLGGEVRTMEQIIADDRDDERILRANMASHGYTHVVTNTNSWKFTAGINADDVVIAWPREVRDT